MKGMAVVCAYRTFDDQKSGGQQGPPSGHMSGMRRWRFGLRGWHDVILDKMCFKDHRGFFLLQVMKAGTTPAQRRRLGDHSLLVAMDPQTKRLLRYEEVNLCRRS